MLKTEPSFHVDYPWETLEALLRGISSIDLLAMPITSQEEAYDFVLSYGYDLLSPEDLAEIEAIFQEAIQVIETLFLKHPQKLWGEHDSEPLSPRLTIPSPLRLSSDPINLILQASQGKEPIKHWACAILKVMHTIAHIQNGPYYRHFDEAKAQILERFEQILTPLGQQDGVLLGKLGGPILELYGFETKDQKSRESILIKLLCKKEHVAESVWDMIGVRLITYTPAEAVLALNILRQQRVVIFPNIIPSRSRNNLVNLTLFRLEYEKALQDLQDGQISLDTFNASINQLNIIPQQENDFTTHNPSSAEEYRSIHLTCRQLIRIKAHENQLEHRFFFPYEIQILDKASYLESKEGSSSHSLYKQKQLASARRRVLGPLLGISKT